MNEADDYDGDRYFEVDDYGGDRYFEAGDHAAGGDDAMKDFYKLIEECLAEVTAVGIIPGNIEKWELNYRAKRRWGQCQKKKTGEITIQIAARLIEDDRISEKACKETMIHEILHACPDGMSHTGKWKEYAKLMNDTYGYNIKRTTSGEEKGVENYVPTRRKTQYVFMCRYCKQIVTKTRKCKFTHYYKNYTCGICGSPRAFVKY